jgi:glutamate--cysteine ligase
MPINRRVLTVDAAEDLCTTLFAPSAERVGLELEWPVHRRGSAAIRPTPAEMSRLGHRRLPAGGRVTFEPGGQIELSTAPQCGVSAALEAVGADEHALKSELAVAGLVAETMPVDDRRAPQRVRTLARYAAMERFFSAQGPNGAWMMCNTAATQINISHDGNDPGQRWLTLHLVAPVLIAAFANSPGTGLDGTRWASLRQGIWWSIDRGRTRPVRTDLPPARAWLHYALAADVMFINREGSQGDDGIALSPGLPFGHWMARGHPVGWPTAEDFRYHLSTLFPPIRPRGWLELRVLDALPGWIRDVATLTVAASCTGQAGRELRRRLPSTRQLWVAAARHGLRHPVLHAAARELFAVVSDNVGRVSDHQEHADLLQAYRSAYVGPGRTPGDDHGRDADLRTPVAALTGG